MKKQRSGHLVNISAAIADQPSGAALGLLARCVTAVSKTLALEYAADNIRFQTQHYRGTPYRTLAFPRL